MMMPMVITAINMATTKQMIIATTAAVAKIRMKRGQSRFVDFTDALMLMLVLVAV